MEGVRKRRKWDVAAPGGTPLAGNQAGIGAGGTGQADLNGFITAQGHQMLPSGAPASFAPLPPAAAAASQPGVGNKANQSLDQATIARAQQGAQAIVERINAELRAKGQLPALRGPGRFHDDTKEIAREVIINDAPPPIRYNLTKRSVQDDIQRRTNTIVVIKGRYQAPGMAADDQEGPLRLRIMPGNIGPDDMIKQRAVDAGASEVRRFLQNGSTSRSQHLHTNPPPSDRSPGYGAGVGGGQSVQSNGQMQNMPAQHGLSVPQAGVAQQAPGMAHTVPLYVGVEDLPGFNLHQRLKGPGDSYLLHISSTTGATVTLRGRGSGIYDSPDHLHLFVSATNPKSFEDAKGLSANLIDTVRAEHAKSLSAQPPLASQPPSYAQPQLPYQPSLSYANPGQANPSPTGYQQASTAYPLAPYPSHSQAYEPRPAGQPAPHSRYSSQPSSYPTSSYAAQSSYPPSAASSMPPSSYPSSSIFTPGAPHPGAASVGTPHPHPHGQQHVQPGLTPRAQAEGAHFQGPPGQHGSSQPPVASQQHAQQQHASAGAYGSSAVPQQQPPAGSFPAAQLPPYSQQGNPYARPQGPTAAPHPQSAVPGHSQQAQVFGQQASPYNMPAAQMHMQPDYGPPRQPGMDRGVQAMGAPGQHGGVRPQQGMSHEEMAQQAERKRRFTEQKREDQLRQDTSQQPTKPAYGAQAGLQTQQGFVSSGPMPLSDREPNVRPATMGPPPPRVPVQSGMGSMGPPPPRAAPSQGAQVQLQPLVQGLVPYGDDD